MGVVRFLSVVPFLPSFAPSLPPSLPPFLPLQYLAFIGPTTLLTATLSPVNNIRKRRKMRRSEEGREGGRKGRKEGGECGPVKMASSTLNATAVNILTSAGTWSPSLRLMMSPGTSSSVGSLGREGRRERV